MTRFPADDEPDAVGDRVRFGPVPRVAFDDMSDYGPALPDEVTRALVQFLHARLDEDEQGARAAGGGGWLSGEPSTIHPDTTVLRTVVTKSPAGSAWAQPRYVCGSILAADAEHIVRYDPARVLREVAVKRATVAAYESTLLARSVGVSLARIAYWQGRFGEREWVLRTLASVYDHHPDFQPEWAAGIPVATR